MSGFSGAGCVVKLTCDIFTPEARPECLQVTELMKPGGIVGGLYVGIFQNGDTAAVVEGAELGNKILDVPTDPLFILDWLNEIREGLEKLQERLQRLRIDKELDAARGAKGRLLDDPRETAPRSELPGPDSDTAVA
jgi:hypothetical protein